MTHYIKDIGLGLKEARKEIHYGDPAEAFMSLQQSERYKFIFESKDTSPISGRMSLIGIDPALKIRGKDEHFEIEVLNDRGNFYLDKIEGLREMCDSFEEREGFFRGVIRKDGAILPEDLRSRRKNIAQVVALILETFKVEERVQLGLYGAFSYDFVRLFEDITPLLNDNGVDDFQLFLYDTFLFFDHLKEKSEIIVFRENEDNLFTDIERRLGMDADKAAAYQIGELSYSFDEETFAGLVREAKEYMKKGEIFEVVFSNIIKAKFQGDPLGLYFKYRDSNPSPYMFYFDFGHEQLVGASPEMMVRVEGGIAHIRPISGTIKRGADPIEDYENMLELLTDVKEKAELDMLIDLGRNDLSRVCEPGVSIKDYRFVEKYSAVMHTVAHVMGTLRPEFKAFDALIACLNAGTLTGAPKVSAMQLIEKHEKERRGFYGGSLGYLTFSGEMDTCIIIRTAHIRGERLRFQVGATLLNRSVPEKEYIETINKAEAFIKIINQPSHV